MVELSGLTKEELSVKICDLLGVQVDFSPMKKEDLVKLYDALSKLFRPLSEMSLRELLNEVTSGEGRILPRVRKRVRDFLEERKKESKEGA